MPASVPNLLPNVLSSSLTQKGFAQANGGTSQPQTSGVASTQNNPYSFNNYYTAHPDAKPGYVDPNAAANTFSGGVNSSGQTLPGYTPTPTPTFPGMVGGLVGLSSQPSQGFNTAQGNAQTAASGLIGMANNPNPAIDRINQEEQRQVGATLTGQPGQPLELAQGRAGLIENTANAAIQNALQEQNLQQQALQGAGSTANASAGAATSQQGTQQSGLGTAGGLIPEALRYGVGGANNGGSLNPLNNIDSIAQQVISGQISPSQAYSMGGSISNFQGALNQAILQKNPSFNIAQAQGKFDANQSNTTTAGTAPTNAAANTYQQLYPQLLQLQNTTSNVDQFGNLLLKTMQDSSGNTINPSDVKYANTTISQIRNQLSSAQQATFDSTFASLKSRVSGLLAMGGSEIPTQITSDANKIIDGSLPLSSLSAVLQRITTEGNILTSNLQNQLNTAGSSIGAPKAGTSSNPLNI